MCSVKILGGKIVINNWITSYKTSEGLLSCGYRKLNGLTRKGEEVYKHIQPTGATYVYTKGGKVTSGLEKYSHPKCGEFGTIKVSNKGKILKIFSVLNRGKRKGFDTISRNVVDGTFRSTTTSPKSKVTVHFDTMS